MYTGVIFDLDGVICFTDQYHYQAWKQMADKLHIYFDEEINNRLRGVSRLESLEIILEKSNIKYTKEQKIKFAEEKNDIYKILLKQMNSDDLPGEVMNTLQELKARGLKLAIGSSSRNAKTILSQIGMDKFFDAVSDGTNIVCSKPNPEVFLKAAEFLDENPEKCLVIEDAESGIEAAWRGHFDSAGLGEATKHKHVTYKLKKISDLLSII